MVLYVGNLDVLVTEKDLQQLFKQYGPIINIQVMRRERTRSFAYILLEDDDMAHAAISELHGTTHNGRKLTVSDRGPRQSLSKNKKHKRPRKK